MDGQRSEQRRGKGKIQLSGERWEWEWEMGNGKWERRGRESRDEERVLMVYSRVLSTLGTVP
jgi:hypothetical protein